MKRREREITTVRARARDVISISNTPEGEGERKDKSVWGRAMQVSIYRVSETKNDTAERETARKNVPQTKKEMAKARDTAYTV